jgi:hypothetical protein
MMKKHYIFKATGIDTSRHNKKRQESKHAYCTAEQARAIATDLRRSLTEAGWTGVIVRIYIVEQMQYLGSVRR